MSTDRTIPWIMALTLFARTLSAENAVPPAENRSPAAQAINHLGLDLLNRAGEANANALLSPFSIQTALAMTFAGAGGETRAEMAKVLHYPPDNERELHQSFADLQAALEKIATDTTAAAERATKVGHPTDPVTLTVANRLFGQQSYEFREPFMSLTKEVYRSPLELLDFKQDPSAAVAHINQWVENQTRQRIRDLIPPDGLNRDTRLVLVNAIYLKAPWANPFNESRTKPEPFHMRGVEVTHVPTMTRQGRYGYAKREGFSAITIPYSGGNIQFLILLPDDKNGLGDLEKKITADSLSSNAECPQSELILHLPKFKIEPPSMKLGEALRSLGMRSAFDEPRGSANFDRMAPRKPNDYLAISEVFHKTFLDLDEKGTEAAAATAVSMIRMTSAMPAKTPPEVRVDHPFLFAIQHRPTTACLFLGRVTAPDHE